MELINRMMLKKNNFKQTSSLKSLPYASTASGLAMIRHFTSINNFSQDFKLVEIIHALVLPWILKTKKFNSMGPDIPPTTVNPKFL